jgi:hypothetical protein
MNFHYWLPVFIGSASILRQSHNAIWDSLTIGKNNETRGALPLPYRCALGGLGRERKVDKRVYVAGCGKDADKGLLVDVGVVKGAERWTRDRREAMHVSPGMARRVIEVPAKAGISAAVSS